MIKDRELKIFTKYYQDDIPSVTAEEARTRMVSGAETIFLDVRETWEHQLRRIDPSILIPVGHLPRRINELESDRDREIIVYCAHGNRSKTAVRFLRSQGYNAVNMSGGIQFWK